MKRNTIIIFVIIAIAIFALYLSKKGYDVNSVVNLPKTADVSVECSRVHDLLFTSTVDIVIKNNSTRVHNNVMIKIIGFDNNGNEVKEKTTTFERTLEPNSSLSKPVTMPAKVKRCDCLVLNSDIN